MTRTCRTALIVFCLLLSLALIACGVQPAAAPSSSTQEPSSAEATHPTEQPRPTEGTSPTEQPPPPTEGGAVTLPDVAEAYARAENLPSFHFEGTFQGQQGGAAPQYLRLVQDVDDQGNMRLQAFDEEGGEPTLDLYFVDQHLYMGTNGRYIDMGVQDMQQVSTFYQLYQTPFTAALVGATNLEPLGKENVNGLTATKYQASFEEWVRTYVQVKQGISYTAEGYIWIADEYGAIVKSSVVVAVNEGGEIKSFSAESEISQVGQVAPITAPK